MKPIAHACRWLASSLLILIAIGCTAAPPQSVAPPQPAAAGGATSGLSAEITFSAFGDPAEAAIFQAIIDAYRAHNPRVTVRPNIIPNQNEFMTKIAASFTAGTPPDVFLVNYRRYGQFVSKGTIEPAEDWMARTGTLKKEDFFELPLKAFTWNGKLQCIPQNQSSLVVYYNKDLFAQYGVPAPREDWHWSDFLQTARSLTKDTDGDGVVDLHGLVMEPTIIRAAPFIWQLGGKLVDDEASPTRITLDDPNTREALRFFMQLSTVHRVVPTEADYKSLDPDSRFMAGKAAMTVNSRRIVPEFRQITAFGWDVAALPQNLHRATTLHSDAYCIAAASPNKAAAWDFVAFANSPDGQQIAARLGRTVPSLKAVASSSAFLDPNQAPANSRVFLDLAPHLKLLPVLAEWPAIERFLNEEIENGYYGVKLYTDAIDAANRRANDQLKR